MHNKLVKGNAKKDITNMQLAEWKISVTRLLEERIKTLTLKFINIRSSITTLKNDIVKRSFNNLHDNFVVVPIEKANDNITMICKCC